MDAQIERAHGHRYDQEPLHPNSAVEGEGDHHEKKSVLNKVKAKARKFKDTLGIKSHAQHGQDNNDEEDEYEEDEEVHDPETTHDGAGAGAGAGAPIYDESPAPKNFGTGQGGTGVQPRTNLGGLDQNVCPGTFQAKVADPTPMHDSGVQRNVGTDHNVNPGQFKGTSGQQDHSADISPTNYKGVESAAPRHHPDQGDSAGQFKGALGKHLDVNQNAPKNRPQDVSPANYGTKATSPAGTGVESAAPRHYTDQGDSAGQFKGALGKQLDVDQNAPKNRPQDVSPANYGTKATNPAGTGTEEAGVTPILKSFGKMDISDEPRPKKEGGTTGSSPTSDWSSNSTIPESYNASTENHPQDMNVDGTAKQRSGYTGTVSSVPSAITDKANSAKKEPTTGSTLPENTPASERFNASTENHPQDMNVDEPAKQQSGYMGTISSVTSALTDRAISAKNVVASKVGYGGTNNDGTGSQMNKEGEDVVSAGVPMTGKQSSYADKISSATSAITGKAVSAKDVVAAKLGYGENKNRSSPTASEVSKGTSTSPTAAEMNTGGENAQSGGVTGYGRQISSTVTGKLAPVSGKVAGVGGAVVSKLPGTGTNKNAGTDSDTHTTTGSDMDRGTGVPVETGSGVGGTTDRGVGVKGYVAEKLKPGEEDKALSEIISGALNKRGKGVDDEEKRAMGEVVSDGFHKRGNDDEMKNENKPMGKVRESEEVANRLGSSESEKLGKIPSSSESSPRTGVVDKVKGALTNWFGKGGETNPSQAFTDQSPSDASGKQDISTFGSNNDNNQDGERRLQESTN